MATPHMPRAKTLRILFTNNSLGPPAGSEVALRDLAICLLRRGHFPVAYSLRLGDVAAELARATIPVIDDLSQLAEPPDIIHGQHHLEAVTAALHFPLTPMVFVCHGWQPWEEDPPRLPSIRCYVAVDHLCRERIVATRGIAPERVTVIANAVDIGRFPQRAHWRAAPLAALIFSNYAHPNDWRTETIRAACRRAGIDRVDVLGVGAGNSHPDPGVVLQNYDIVFAKARCALEAMATGAAVIVTDYAGLAGMVTPDRVAEMRKWNFGARTMQAAAVTEDNLLREVLRYDPADARRVSDMIRGDADLERAADRWLAIYETAMTIAGTAPGDPSMALRDQSAAASRYLAGLTPFIKQREAAEHRAGLAEAARAEISAAHAALAQRLAEAEIRIQAADARADDAEARAAQTEQKLADISVARDLAVGGQAGLEAENAALRTDRDAHRTTVSAITASRTWRMMTRLGALKGRIAGPRPPPPFPVIVGVPRSGTTLLRLMLDSHPQLALPPETGFLASAEIRAATADPLQSARLLTSFPPDAPAWRDFGLDAEAFVRAAGALPANAGLPDVLRLFYAQYAQRRHKPRSGDKTPLYLGLMTTVASVLPEARFVHIVRDGRDVALSWRETWFAPSRSLPELVAHWAADIAAARAMARAVNYLEVRYEDLVRQPETVLRSICAFVDLAFSPAMLRYHAHAADRLREHGERRTANGDVVVSREDRLAQQWRATQPLQPDRIGVWRSEMSAADQALCLAAGAGLLEGD